MSTHNHTAISTGAAANAATFNTPLGALDAAIGDLSALDTTAKTSAVAAINETRAAIDTTVDATRSGQDANLMWDPFTQHVEDKSAWAGKSWWEDNSGLSLVVDSSNPYGGRTLRSTTSAKGRGIYIASVGLQPGDVISAGVMCKASSGTYALRLVFRQSSPSGTAISTSNGSSHTFSGDTVALTIDNVTIPPLTEWITIAPYSASPTSIDIYGTWIHRGATAAAAPAPSEFTAYYLRTKEWETGRKRLMIRNIDASNFAVYQPLADGQTWLAWLFTKLATNNWTYYGANMCTDNAGTGAYAALVFDIGYSINYTPDGQSAETCGNHHLYDDFTAVAFYNEAGTTVDPTASGAAFTAAKLRIQQTGTLRHPDTSTTDHATISRFIEISLDGIYEHQRLSWLTSNNLVAYWNTGQLLASSATRAYVHNNGDAAFTTADSTETVAGKTKAYTWYHSRTFAFEVECPTAEAIQLRETTLKLYPRTIETDDTRDAGDVDHAEWFWRVIYDKEFAKRI